MKVEAWRGIEDCEECYFKNSTNFDGKLGCSRTGSPLERVKTCLENGPMIRAPRTAEELRRVIEATQRHWRRERVESPGIALVK